MKALSVRQPWASLIAEGRKTVELRSRRTSYRGPVLICASRHGQGDGPKGMALAVVDLVDCRPVRPTDREAACCLPKPREYAWVLSGAHPIVPFPVKGMLGLFRAPEVECLKTESLSAIGDNPRGGGLLDG